MDREAIVRYWHAVELLQPQSAPAIRKRSSLHAAFFHDTPCLCPTPPWAPESLVSKQALPDRREWSHTLYAHVYDSRLVSAALEALYGADQGYREPQSRESAVFAAKFTMDGRLVEKSLVLSSEAWFLGRALAGQNWTRGFEIDQRAAAEQAAIQLQGRVSSEDLQDFSLWMLQFLGLEHFFPANAHYPHRFRSQPVNPNKPASEDDPLNSFLLDDLATVADSIRNGVTGVALQQYLSRHDPETRLHIDADSASDALIDHLLPPCYADGCWPSERHLGLVHSQQLAVNRVLATLGQGQGLQGINGPPGTGKTTLLRDLIAAIVTNRADMLATLERASDGFASDARETCNDSGKEQFVYKLNPALYGFEIVVASSNNGAVENVTLELPQRDKIDASWLPDAEHFAELGELITGKPAWGLISGALGSKARRKTFVDRYFYGQRSVASQDSVGNSADTDENNVAGTLFADIDIALDDSDDMPSGEENKPEGLLKWLGTHTLRNKGLTSDQRRTLWQHAVAQYQAAKAEVRTVSEKACHIRMLIQSLQTAREKIRETTLSMQALEQRLADTAEHRSRLNADDARIANQAFTSALESVARHYACKPGLWAKLSSLGQAARTWTAVLAVLEEQRNHAKAECDRVTRLVKQREASRQQLEQHIARSQLALQQWRLEDQSLTKEASELAAACRADHLLTWLRSGVIGRGDAIELAEPWNIKSWRQARARVFIEALKLHRVFFELEASRIRANLFLVNALLTGPGVHGVSRDAIRSVWASLFMVVPVLSSTFASFGRSFGSLGAGEIGWLLVDEAGQAPPQAAVGALWRARRALLVGDPLQLKPIVTVSDAALEHMRARYRIDSHWLPNRQSAQTLADQATTWGRMAGPPDSKIWVGLPLVVHRRCDRPMYDVANRIAYDGAMVYGTIAPHAEKETPARLPTGWIHVSGPSEGNWVPAEGKALQALLELLRQDRVTDDDISVITPFKAVREQLKVRLGTSMVCGTIHTMQGKEAPVVILMLGGNAEAPGARNWAVSEPNLLNVAVTRAKRRLYVIGDRNDWQNRALFCDVMDLLPRQRLPEIKALEAARYTVIKPHRTEFPQPIQLKTGDAFAIGESYQGYEGWEGWVFCTAPGQPGGWVPEQIIARQADGTGRALTDYSARELNVDVDECLVGFTSLNGWVWCQRLAIPDEGWVPLENLRVEQLEGFAQMQC